MNKIGKYPCFHRGCSSGKKHTINNRNDVQVCRVFESVNAIIKGKTELLRTSTKKRIYMERESSRKTHIKLLHWFSLKNQIGEEG